MADAADSKSAGGNIVWVQVPPSALRKLLCEFPFLFFIQFYITKKVPQHFNIAILFLNITSHFHFFYDVFVVFHTVKNH